LLRISEDSGSNEDEIVMEMAVIIENLDMLEIWNLVISGVAKYKKL
jgi:hypothetical protein